jgi:acylpyruvate hydrolase
VRLVTIRTAEGPRAARLDGESLALLDAPDVGELLQDPNWRERAAKPKAELDLAAAELAPVVPRPEKIICVGLNYRSHAVETGLEIPEYPALFAKYSRSLIGPRDAISLPPDSALVDWEAELCVVVGSTVRRAGAEEAERAIAGYTVANDISMRDWQRRTSEWLQGKTFEGSTPVGPALVTADEIDDPGALRLWCEVNDERMQEASTEDLIFPPAELVAYISRLITLCPGDLILTGTPGGIGARQQPPRFLTAKDVVRTGIDGLGELTNECRPEEELGHSVY